jgi:hypothetical protein
VIYTPRTKTSTTFKTWRRQKKNELSEDHFIVIIHRSSTHIIMSCVWCTLLFKMKKKISLFVTRQNDPAYRLYVPRTEERSQTEDVEDKDVIACITRLLSKCVYFHRKYKISTDRQSKRCDKKRFFTVMITYQKKVN